MLRRMPDRRPPIRVHVARANDDVPVLPIAIDLLRHPAGDESFPAPDHRIFGAWRRHVQRGDVIASPSGSADVILCAHDSARHSAAAIEAVRRASGFRVPVLMYTESDDIRRSAGVHGLVWRSSALRSRLQGHERVATGFVPDLTAEREELDPVTIPWDPTPGVGFIGHVASGIRALGYLRKGWQNFHGFALRERVLRLLERPGPIRVDFLRRTRNLGPPMTGVGRDAAVTAMRREYVRSVFTNPYSLCIRGAGNWSYRLFETLSAGRIPLLIDTDTALPLEGEIDWDSHLCRVPIAEVEHAAQMLAAFHGRLGPQGLQDMQLRNRRLWLERLEPSAFMDFALRVTAELRVSGRNVTKSDPQDRP